MTKQPPTTRLILITPEAQQLARNLTHAAIRIDAAKATIRTELQHAGWPARSPEGDRKPSVNTCTHTENCTCPAIDYHDPTGEQAIALDRLHDTREAIEDHLELIRTSTIALEHLARRILPDQDLIDTDGHRVAPVPACTVCGREGERKPSGDGWRNTERIAGKLFATGGVLCGACRKRQARAA